jgi:hypothetical protein
MHLCDSLCLKGPLVNRQVNVAETFSLPCSCPVQYPGENLAVCESSVGTEWV